VDHFNTPSSPRSRTGMAIVLAVLIGGLLLFLSWFFRFPWDYVW
jgi:hypothetical protein